MPSERRKFHVAMDTILMYYAFTKSVHWLKKVQFDAGNVLLHISKIIFVYFTVLATQIMMRKVYWLLWNSAASKFVLF